MKFYQNNITNSWQLINFLIIPLLVFLVMIKFVIKSTSAYQEKLNKGNYALNNNLLWAKTKFTIANVIFFIMIGNVTFLLPWIPFNMLQNNCQIIIWQLVPLLSFTALIQIIICFTFLNKNPKKIKFWNNFRTSLFTILLLSILWQFLFISWSVHHILFTNIGNFGLVAICYPLFFYAIYRMFNRNFLIVKFLIANTCRIIVTKTKNLPQQKPLSFYQKSKLIIDLWKLNSNDLFANNKSSCKKSSINKIIITNLVLFFVACRNFLLQNTTKNQKIIINGWKNNILD